MKAPKFKIGERVWVYNGLIFAERRTIKAIKRRRFLRPLYFVNTSIGAVEAVPERNLLEVTW
jgi:hypothetical protein